MKLLRQESKVILAYEDTIIEHGASDETVTDNTKALVSTRFKNISHKYSIITDNTVPYCQQSKFTEGEGRNFKFPVYKYLLKDYMHLWCAGITVHHF